MWKCANCGERVEDNFGVCWSCQAERVGTHTEENDVDEEDEGWECLSCGADVSVEDNMCPKCGADISDVTNLGETSSEKLGPKSDHFEDSPRSANFESPVYVGGHFLSSDPSAVLRRYSDAYGVAKAIVRIGTVIKVVGGILAILIGILAMVFSVFIFAIGASAMRGGDGGIVSFAALILGIALGGIVFIFFYVCGVLVSAQGQILKAGLDTAVHGSPFISDEQKARIMSLI